MSNSPLVVYTALSPNHSGRRNQPITKITPHYMGGNCTVETCGEIFASTSRMASSNYGIGSDGRVALYVDEANRAWTSGSSWNDNRAVTIEVANLGDSSVTDAAWNSLVELCADICRRNGITECSYTGTVDGVLTKHKWFQDTDCPGDFLSGQFDRLAREVNAKLSPKPQGWRCEDGLWFKYEDGERVRGWHWDGEYSAWFNFDPEGTMRTGWFWDEESANWYCFDERGFMRTGWYEDNDGQWYYLYPEAVSDPDVPAGHPKGSMARSAIVIDGGRSYAIKESGAMARGEVVEIRADMSGEIHA